MIPRSSIYKMEEFVEQAVRHNFPADWEEDFITRFLLKKLRSDLNGLHLSTRGHPFTVHWSIYKNTGKQEQMFGDIGLLVRCSFKDGRTLEGVSYLEAKKRFNGRNTFEEMRIKQMHKIVKHAPRSHLLLYDYEQITDFPTIDFWSPWFEEFWGAHPAYRHVPATYAVVVPISTVLALGVKDTRLYGSGNPFSHQLLVRYIHGLDLEFSSQCIGAAKGFAEKIGAPRYLLLADVIEQGTDQRVGGGINQDRLTPLEGD